MGRSPVKPNVDANGVHDNIYVAKSHVANSHAANSHNANNQNLVNNDNSEGGPPDNNRLYYK